MCCHSTRSTYYVFDGVLHVSLLVLRSIKFVQWDLQCESKNNFRYFCHNAAVLEGMLPTAKILRVFTIADCITTVLLGARSSSLSGLGGLGKTGKPRRWVRLLARGSVTFTG